MVGNLLTCTQSCLSPDSSPAKNTSFTSVCGTCEAIVDDCGGGLGKVEYYCSYPFFAPSLTDSVGRLWTFHVRRRVNIFVCYCPFET